MKRHICIRQQSCTTIAKDGRLVQVSWSRRGSDKFGGWITSSFTSLRTRPGKIGLFVEKPYHCAAGPHRFRRLPIVPTVKLLVGLTLGHASKFFYSLTGLAKIASRLRYCMDIRRILSERKAAKEWDAFLDQLK